MVTQVVLAGAISALCSIVPPELASISNLNFAFREAPAPLYLTPTATTLTVSEAPIPDAVKLYKDSWVIILLESKSVASLGVTSSTLVYAPQSALSPAAFGLR